MPRLSLRMPNSSVTDSTDSYGIPTVPKSSLHLPLHSAPSVSPNQSSQSANSGNPRMKLAQSNGHVYFQSFRKEEEDDEDEDDDELYLDAVDSLLPISPEDDLRKETGKDGGEWREADTADSNVTTTTHEKNKDTTAAPQVDPKVGAGDCEQKSYDNDEDDWLKMQVNDRFELSALSAVGGTRHSTLKKSFDPPQTLDNSAKQQLNKRRLRFSVRTFSEGVDPQKVARKTVAFASDNETPSLLGSSYRTDSLATIANLPTSSTTTSSTSTKQGRRSLTNKFGLSSDSFLQNFHQRRRRNSSNTNNTQTPVKCVQFPVSLLKGSTTTTEHSSTVQRKPPLRPSILKASSLFVTAGGHRKTCPRSQYKQPRNMSGDALHSSKVSISSTTSNPDARRWRLFGGHSIDDPSVSSRNARNNRVNQVEAHITDEESPFFDASDLTDLHLEPCTCHLDSAGTAPPAKSVHILTPTKSEEILFDPAQSVANSIISVKDQHFHHHRHNTTPHSKQHHNISRQQTTQHQQNDNIRAGNELVRSVKQTDDGCTTTAAPASAQPVCSSKSNDFKERLDLIAGQMYIETDDEKVSTFPTTGNNSSQRSHKSEPSSCSSELTEVSFLEEDEEEEVQKEDEDYQSPYRDTIVSIESMNSKGKNMSIDSSNFLNFKGHHPSEAQLLHNETYIFEKGDGGDVEGLYENNTEEDNDEDLPQYCRRCNIWFDNFDPSYPFRCNCNPVIMVTGTGSIGGTDTLNTNDTVSVYSMHMQKDFRYYFQHPYSRLFIAYFVIFCNFFIFAEDPLSHSLRECSIPVLGNVISFLFTKYPPELQWQLLKGIFGVMAIIFGLIAGKYFCHHFVLRRLFRLKMFRDESGTWMIMLITTVLIAYCFSKLYNFSLKMFHPDPGLYLINSRIGISFASFMKIAACGTWMGDFFTAWMITDMMLQDNLYPDWAPGLRRFWHHHTTIRIVVFWSGALVIAALVIATILSDLICWDLINMGLVSTTELSRAYVACGILFMDLLIVMQDWDFPHFVSDLNIKLPGMLRPSYTLNFCRKSLKFPATEIKISGKWFNYGIIVFVMMLDLNMWKNQIIYYPSDFGQYTDPKTNRVYTVNETTVPEPVNLDDPEVSNYTVWTYDQRLTMHDNTNHSLIDYDLVINSRYAGYSWFWKGSSMIPIVLGFGFFFTLITLYGRFPPKTDRSLGGRLKKRRSKSSWRRERRDSQTRSRHFVVYDGQTGTTTNMAVPIDALTASNINNNYTLEPCRPTATVLISNNGTVLTGPSSQQQQQMSEHFEDDEYHNQLHHGQIFSTAPPSVSLQFITSNNVDYGHPSSESSSSGADSTTPIFSGISTPLSTASTSSSYRRLLPQFNGHIIWSSLLSALSLVGRKDRGLSSNSNHSPFPSRVQVNDDVEGQQPKQQQLRNGVYPSPAATIVTIPPFQPQSMLQYQTQFVQLPLSTQIRAT